jgi:hypothetical protein
VTTATKATKASNVGNIALAAVRRTSKKVQRAETALADAKQVRDDAILAATAAGIGSRTIADASGLSNSGVRKITGADTS